MAALANNETNQASRPRVGLRGAGSLKNPLIAASNLYLGCSTNNLERAMPEVIATAARGLPRAGTTSTPVRDQPGNRQRQQPRRRGFRDYHLRFAEVWKDIAKRHIVGIDPVANWR